MHGKNYDKGISYFVKLYKIAGHMDFRRIIQIPTSNFQKSFVQNVRNKVFDNTGGAQISLSSVSRLSSVNILGGTFCWRLQTWAHYRCHSFTESRYTNQHSLTYLLTYLLIQYQYPRVSQWQTTLKLA